MLLIFDTNMGDTFLIFDWCGYRCGALLIFNSCGSALLIFDSCIVVFGFDGSFNGIGFDRVDGGGDRALLNCDSRDDGRNWWWYNVVEIRVMAGVVGRRKQVVIVRFISVGVGGKVVIIMGICNSRRGICAIIFGKGQTMASGSYSERVWLVETRGIFSSKAMASTSQMVASEIGRTVQDRRWMQ